jgi:uncharacterized alpha-E superfamily protein
MQSFMLEVQNRTALCKARIQTTLIQNQVWSILSLGLLVERSAQILRISEAKLSEMATLPDTGNLVTEAYEISNLLKSLESYDMNRKFYGQAPDLRNALEFLIFNINFPRSLSYCAEHICNHLDVLGIDKKGKENSVKLTAHRFKNELYYGSIDDAMENPLEFIKGNKVSIEGINNNLINNYFFQ